MTLTGKAKVAVLISNGFDEAHFLAAQKALTDMGVCVRIVSMNQGLVNGWSGDSWGHNYAVDTQLNSALGADYDVLVIPGGHRSMDKLKMTEHTRRFISSFMNADKPVAVMGDAIDIMNHVQVIGDRAFSNMGEAPQLDQNLLTGMCDDSYIEMMMTLFSNIEIQQEAA